MCHKNMEYQILYEDCRKSLEVKSEKYGLPSVKKWHSTNHRFAECQEKTLGKGLTAAALCRVFWFAECPTLDKSGLCRVLLFVEYSALGKPPLCRVPVVCWVLSLWHLANSLFAECPIKNTRQSVGHSTKKPSLVVYFFKGIWVVFDMIYKGFWHPTG